MLPDFRVRQRDYLLELARALTQELNLDKLLERVISISIEMLAGQAGLIILRTPPEGWRVQVSLGLPAGFLHYLEPLLAEAPLETDNPEGFELHKINQILQEVTRIASFGLLTGVGLPLVAREKIVGMIFIFRNYRVSFSGNDRALLSSFANQAAIAVQNALLYTQISHEKQRLDALLDSTADGIIILASDHTIERCNPAFSRMLEMSIDQIQGEQHEDIIRWANSPEGLTLEQAEKDGWPLTPHASLFVEGDLRRNNSKVALPVGITYSPLVSQEGQLMNIIATIRDITRWRQADELKSTFISIISHELKTPVALIKGYASTLRREDAKWDPSVVEDSLTVIEEEADRLTLLIENLLDASQLQAGGVKLKRSDVNLPDLTARIVKKLQTQTEKHKISADFPSDFPVVLADENRIQQVISNLISNGIKYSPDGEIYITGQVKPSLVIVCVSDQGPGIAPDDIPHVFDRFYRSPEMAKQQKGAGLGLYLAKAVVEAHGGHIWVDPESGKGARLCFSLPRHPET
ncbi:MAG: PAS domain-containing protein [Anaerolineaceae bacterium]|nr:PAS domain-containing protein [Anaerolineaceae bacterium]